MITNSPGLAGAQQVVGLGQQAIIRQTPQSQPTINVPTAVAMDTKVLDKRRLQELVKEVDPLEQLDDDVEEVYILIQHKLLLELIVVCSVDE